MNQTFLILNPSYTHLSATFLGRLFLVSEAGVVVTKLEGIFRAHVMQIMVVVASFSLLVVGLDENQTTHSDEEHRYGASQVEPITNRISIACNEE